MQMNMNMPPFPNLPNIPRQNLPPIPNNMPPNMPPNMHRFQ